MDRSRALSRARFIAGGAFLAATAALLCPTGEPAAQPTTEALPTPKDFVSGLDLECFATQGPSLNFSLQLTHLNPVLIAMGLPPHQVTIRELTETCVPVMKNGVSPPTSALPFIQHVDFACYRIEAQPISTSPLLTLAHLNPVLAQFPRHNVKLVQPDELCLPVMKNNVLPPAEVQSLVRFLDLECWRVSEDPHSIFTLALRQLNPQLGNIPQHNMTLDTSPRKLCVPVRKNQQAIPDASLNIIRWVDLERFTARPPVTINPVTVVLNHLNPMFTTLPPITVVLQTAQALMVPVSKNNNNPP